MSKLWKLNDLADFKIAKIVFKIINKKLPDSVQNLFQMSSEEISCSANTDQNQRQTCLSVQRVQLWNSLSDELKTCKFIALRTYLQRIRLNYTKLNECSFFF